MNELSQKIPEISIVVPLYCKEMNIEAFLSAIHEVIKPLHEQFEIILVDDGSHDNTWTVIEKASFNYPMLRAIKLSRNFGKEAAISTGLELSIGKAVIVMDGDFQHPPYLIPEMICIWREQGVDVVEAVKQERGKESWWQKVGAKIFYSIFNRLTGYALHNASDYKLIDRRVVAVWLKMGERNLFFRGMISWLGFKQVRITFVVAERFIGKSRWSIFRLFRLAVTAITSFSSLPLHIVTFLGILFFLFSFVLGFQTVYLKITGKAVSGFATVILLLLIIGSLLMISLGIVGEYIARIYHEIKRRPRYIIDRSIDNRIDDLKNR